ncbi:hypothetical protein Tco_0068782 [Tanacetum coccineum]
MGLWYPKDSGFELTAFSDADHAGCLNTRKSTSGGIQFLGDKLVSWMSKKQNCIVMSSAEVEYVVLSASCAQVMWMRTQLQDYGYIRPFGCHVTILNTIDHLGKFDGKFDEGFLVGYSLNSKAFRPVRSENQANKTAGPKEANHSAGTQDNIDAGNSKMEADPTQYYFVLPIYSSYTSTVKSSEAKNGYEKPNGDTSPKTNEEPKDQEDQAFL